MRAEHLFFQRFQPAHRVHCFADAEQSVQIADGPAGGTDVLELDIFDVVQITSILLAQDDGGPAAPASDVVEFHRRGNVLGLFRFGQHEDEERVSDLDFVAGRECALGHWNAVDERTVAAVQILDLKLPGIAGDHAMSA